MLCPNCGYNNQATNRFCVRCGIDVAAPPPASSPSFGAGPPPEPPTDPAAAPPPPVAPPPDPASSAPAPPNPWGAPPAGPYGAPGPPPPPPPSYASGPPAAPNPFAPPVAYGQPGYPPGAYGQYPMPYPPAGFHPPTTNGLAIASLVLGLVGWVPCAVGSVLAIILGFVARSQIRAAQGRQGGDGLALTGIILGFIGVALIILFFTIGAIAGSHSGQS